MSEDSTKRRAFTDASTMTAANARAMVKRQQQRLADVLADQTANELPDTTEAVALSMVDRERSRWAEKTQANKDMILRYARRYIEADRKALADQGYVIIKKGSVPPWMTEVFIEPGYGGDYEVLMMDRVHPNDIAAYRGPNGPNSWLYQISVDRERCSAQADDHNEDGCPHNHD